MSAESGQTEAVAAPWTLERDVDGIAWLTLDVRGASANTLGRAAMSALNAQLRALSDQPPRALAIRSGKSAGFIAGADIREFSDLRSTEVAYEMVRSGQRILDRIEALRCPSVALLHGYALGGGLELALACRYRIAVGDDKLALGLPEVMLGIHPGFGGTVRAVRLLGAPAALDLMLTGRTVRADKALALGLVDELVRSREELEPAARALLQRAPAPRRPSLRARAMSWAPLRPLVRRQVLAQVRRRARREHYPAPYAIVDLWSRYGAQGEAAYEAEARSIAELFLTATSRNLVRVFGLQERLKNLAGRERYSASHVHVVGAGVMGGDIAAWCALRGLSVTLQDRELRWIEPALLRARETFERRLKDPARVSDTLARLRPDVEGAGVGEADIVIEAIFEDLAAKRELYSRLEPRMKADALLATNTSSIELERLADGLADPGRLVGLHFFNPVAQMPLVEIVSSVRTRAECAGRALTFARQIDKLPLPCRSAPGFLVNRVLVPYLHEAMYAAAEGVPLATIDRAAVDFGMPMGPVELADVVGLDVCRHVGEIVAAAVKRPGPDTAPLDALIAAKKLGRKSGEGFYVWRDGKAVKPAKVAAPPPELADRLLLPLVNECAACLREGIVADAGLVDAGIVFGAGFAPFRGGPLHYAGERGHEDVVASLERLAARFGPRFTPDPLWYQMPPTGGKR
jgi:3-hydroxyacyl-CoA dehydrogenase/enoyl-CoA hydratase/3-hydroxybutyryl-CoA epimerase